MRTAWHPEGQGAALCDHTREALFMFVKEFPLFSFAENVQDTVSGIDFWFAADVLCEIKLGI